MDVNRMVDFLLSKQQSKPEAEEPKQ